MCRYCTSRENVSRKGEMMEHFSLSVLGYNRKEVNQRFDEIQSTIANLEKEFDILKQEHEKVSEELDHYKGMEAALKKGIVDARVVGNQIIEESNQRAQSLMDETNEQIQAYKTDVSQRSRKLVDSGSEMKDQMKAMKQEFQTILDTYQEKLDQTDFDSLYPKKSMERLLSEINAYDVDSDPIPEDVLIGNLEGSENSETIENQPVRKQAISDEEKAELEKLIQEVISNESDKSTSSEGKLVDFSRIMNS